MNEPEIINIQQAQKKRKIDTNQKLKEEGVKRGKRNFKGQKHIDLVSFNAGAEGQFVEEVRKLIEKAKKKYGRNTVPITEVLQECAYELDVSPSTVKRYLIKYSARRAPLTVAEMDVMLNPNYGEDEVDE